MTRRFLISGLLSALLLGCGNASADRHPSDVTSDSVVEVAVQDEDVSFQDILSQYQALNERLESVAYRLQSGNADLCPRTTFSVGFTVHNVFDYPEDLQIIAREFLSVSENISIRTVGQNTPANRAGLQPGDEIVQIDRHAIPNGPTAMTLYRAAVKQALEEEQPTITIRRDGEILSKTLSSELICDYPVTLFFSEQVNGHTDGKEIWITSELIRATPRDTDLALVVAHEMAHAVAGHMTKLPTKALELQADRMALIMLARSGFDISEVSAHWEQTLHPEMDHSRTHPTSAERLENAHKTENAILRAQEKGDALTFSVK